MRGGRVLAGKSYWSIERPVDAPRSVLAFDLYRRDYQTAPKQFVAHLGKIGKKDALVDPLRVGFWRSVLSVLAGIDEAELGAADARRLCTFIACRVPPSDVGVYRLPVYSPGVPVYVNRAVWRSFSEVLREIKRGSADAK